jgi:hypothetical protein
MTQIAPQASRWKESGGDEGGGGKQETANPVFEADDGSQMSK